MKPWKPCTMDHETIYCLTRCFIQVKSAHIRNLEWNEKINDEATLVHGSTKLGPFSTFQLLKLSLLCYHFLSSFENKNNFFNVPSNPPPIAVTHWPINFTKKNLRFCIFSTTKKKVTSLNRDIHSGDSWPYEHVEDPKCLKFGRWVK